jgi:hypothetical protein
MIDYTADDPRSTPLAQYGMTCSAASNSCASASLSRSHAEPSADTLYPRSHDLTTHPPPTHDTSSAPSMSEQSAPVPSDAQPPHESSAERVSTHSN